MSTCQGLRKYLHITWVFLLSPITKKFSSCCYCSNLLLLLLLLLPLLLVVGVCSLRLPLAGSQIFICNLGEIDLKIYDSSRSSCQICRCSSELQYPWDTWHTSTPTQEHTHLHTLTHLVAHILGSALMSELTIKRFHLPQNAQLPSPLPWTLHSQHTDGIPCVIVGLLKGFSVAPKPTLKPGQMLRQRLRLSMKLRLRLQCGGRLTHIKRGLLNYLSGN